MWAVQADTYFDCRAEKLSLFNRPGDRNAFRFSFDDRHRVCFLSNRHDFGHSDINRVRPTARHETRQRTQFKDHLRPRRVDVGAEEHERSVEEKSEGHTWLQCFGCANAVWQPLGIGKLVIVQDLSVNYPCL